MSCPVNLVVRPAALYPSEILPEFRRSHPRKTNPQQTLIKRQQAPTPTQNLLRWTTHLFEIEGPFHPQRLSVREDDVPIDSSEVNEIAEQVTIVGPLDQDIDPASGLS